MNTGKKLKDAAIFIALSLLSFTFVYPLFFMLVNSFKTKVEYRISAFALPESFNTSNFKLMFDQFKILDNFKNTLIIALVSVAATMLLAVFASYAFAKLEFRGKNAVYLLIIATMFIPGQVTIIPLYYLFSKLHLVNTLTSVILSYIAGGLPGTILLLTSNFRGISNEVIEAAKIDGAGYFKVVRNVIVPMGMSAIAINIVLSFISSSNDLFTPMILAQKMEKRTVMVALSSIMSRTAGDPAFQLCGLLLSTVPQLAIYIVFQKYIVRGLTVGAIK